MYVHVCLLQETKVAGLRPMLPRDVPALFRLLNEYLNRFDLCPVFQTEEEVAWWFVPRDSIVTTYIVEVSGQSLSLSPSLPPSLPHSLSLSRQDTKTMEVTDMFSFYHLPSTVVKHPTHRFLNVAYSFYNVSTATPLRDLMQDALVVAKEVWPYCTVTVAVLSDSFEVHFHSLCHLK